MKLKEVTLNKLKRHIPHTKFARAYQKLMTSEKDSLLSFEDKFILLKLAIIFCNFGDKHLKKLGYRIILRYSNLSNDYIPLYDIAMANDHISVAKFIEINYLNKEKIENSFNCIFLSAYKENFKYGEIYLSAGQKDIIEFAEETSGNFAIVAPTSYGKTDIIISLIKKNISKKVCIVVPTKALLSQTRKRIMGNEDLAKQINRIIVHQDMYKGNEKNFVAVLTQERLLRLLEENEKLGLDLILVDEAHNLLYGEARDVLLAQVLMLSKKRNSRVEFQFFTPFLVDVNSLKIPYMKYEIEEKKVEENIKVERYYYCEKKNRYRLYLYDQFIDEPLNIEGPLFDDDISFIMHHKGVKNIVYLNRTRDLETAALDLASQNGSLNGINKEVEELCKDISSYLHEDYNLLKCIKGGVVYHHGSMPDIIRLYAEDIFTKMHEFKFIVTSSTLLEGVNIPAEKMFVLNCSIGTRYLSSSQFRNLAGRVCRFKDVFKENFGNLKMLEPDIYVVGGIFARKGVNIKNFLKHRVKDDKKISDKIENVLLLDKEKNTAINEEKKEEIEKALEYLENIEPETTKTSKAKYAQSEIGKACFKNNVTEFDIIEKELNLQKLFETIDKNTKIDDLNNLLSTIAKLFITLIDFNESLTRENVSNLLRLENPKAQSFYAMLLSWRMSGSPYKMMIRKFLDHWDKVEDKIVYFGKKWGEIKRKESDFSPLFVDISRKPPAQRVNLAIVRIKEEQDFIDNVLIKYIEVLNDLGLLDKTFYEKIKYGSADPDTICLLKNGFSMDLAGRVTEEKYKQYVSIDVAEENVKINPDIISAMKEHGENKLIIFEVGYHLS
ncbi:MAG: DEAD/DEAH box helicase family protein [Candidatus Omnitrophica bacterium]|nr:DEAD/DEAH box helicase family protein [Candidatus Omnitrophota bacterium]